MIRFVLIGIVTLLLIGGLAGCAGNTNAPPVSVNPVSSEDSKEKPKEEPSDSIPESGLEETAPESYLITDENYFDYQPGLECSAFSSAYLLRHYGEEADGLTLYETFPSRIPEGGAYPSGIETFFNERGGYEAVFTSGGTVDELKKRVSKGAPVIVFIHVQEPYETTHNTHYVPVVGYDSEFIYFAESLSDYANCKEEEGLSYNRKTEIAQFERLWKNIDGMWDAPYFVINKK